MHAMCRTLNNTQQLVSLCCYVSKATQAKGGVVRE